MENQIEQWRPWSVNPRFMVSRSGKVVDTALKNKTLPIQTRPDGYCKVSLIDDSKRVYEKGRWVNLWVHRLVASTFLPNPENLPEVNHKDRNKANNHIDNLEWITHRDNIVHSFKTRVMPKGDKHWHFGIPKTAEQKLKMSLEKIGEKHPKFKGWYCKDGIKYPSARQAEVATGIPQKTILRHTKRKHNGWAFLPKLKDNALNVGIELSDFISPPALPVPVPKDPSPSDLEDLFS